MGISFFAACLCGLSTIFRVIAMILDQIRFVVLGLAEKVSDQADTIAELRQALANEDADDQFLQDSAAQANAERDQAKAALEATKAQLQSLSDAFAADQAQDKAQEDAISDFLAPFAQMLTPPAPTPDPEPTPEPPAEEPTPDPVEEPAAEETPEG